MLLVNIVIIKVMNKFQAVIDRILTESPDWLEDENGRKVAGAFDQGAITFVTTKYGNAWANTTDDITHAELTKWLVGEGRNDEEEFINSSISYEDLEKMETDPNMVDLAEDQRNAVGVLTGRYFTNNGVMSFWNDQNKIKEHQSQVDSLLKDLELYKKKDVMKFEAIRPSGWQTYDEMFTDEEAVLGVSAKRLRELQAAQHLDPRAKKELRQNPDVFKPKKKLSPMYRQYGNMR